MMKAEADQQVHDLRVSLDFQIRVRAEAKVLELVNAQRIVADKGLDA